MAAEIDAFTRLALEHERTQFALYGYRNKDGTQGGPYLKLAYSLSEALSDLRHNPGVADEGGYLVTDAFVEASDDDAPTTVHVELISVAEILGRAEGQA